MGDINITHDRTEESPVAAHFNSTGHTEADVMVMIIGRLLGNDFTLKKIRDSRWIRTLDS